MAVFGIPAFARATPEESPSFRTLRFVGGRTDLLGENRGGEHRPFSRIRRPPNRAKRFGFLRSLRTPLLLREPPSPTPSGRIRFAPFSRFGRRMFGGVTRSLRHPEHYEPQSTFASHFGRNFGIVTKVTSTPEHLFGTPRDREGNTRAREYHPRTPNTTPKNVTSVTQTQKVPLSRGNGSGSTIGPHPALTPYQGPRNGPRRNSLVPYKQSQAETEQMFGSTLRPETQPRHAHCNETVTRTNVRPRFYRNLYPTTKRMFAPRRRACPI